MQTGVLKPAAVDKEIVRKVPYRSVNAYLTTLTAVKPQEFLDYQHLFFFYSLHQHRLQM